jgi:hypothetical protein
MKRILVYIKNPSSADIRRLRALFGEQLEISSLPIVSGPIDTDLELQSIQDQLSRLSSSSSLGVIIVPEELSPMTSEEAIRVIKSNDAWKEFLESFGVSSRQIGFQVSDHARYWIVAAIRAGGGIPPGIGFLVDKFSQRVFSRRLVDLYDHNGKLF